MKREDLLLEQWKMASELHRHEDDLIWNRFIYFVTLEGILLSAWGAMISQTAAAGSSLNGKPIEIVISAFGAIISVAWFLMQIRAKLYHRFRIEQAKEAERLLTIDGLRVLNLYESGLDNQKLFRINWLERNIKFVSTNRLIELFLF